MPSVFYRPLLNCNAVRGQFFLHRLSFCFYYEMFPCSINDGQLKLEEAALTKAMLENTKCFLLDCGAEIYVWVGRVTQMEDRKSATKAVEVNS